MIQKSFSLKNFADFEVITRGNFFSKNSIAREIGRRIDANGFSSTINDPEVVNMIARDYFGYPVVSSEGTMLGDALDIQIAYSENGAKIDKVMQALKPSFDEVELFSGGMLISIYITHISVTYQDVSEITLQDNIVYNAIMIRILLILTRSLQ